MASIISPPLQQQQQQQSFRPLEYWKPPKAVRHHIRAKSSAIFSPGGRGERVAHTHTHSFAKLEEGRNTPEQEVKKPEMSFATLGKMVSRIKGGGNQQINMADTSGRPMGPPPAYKVDRDDTLGHPWWNAKHWGKKGWFITLGVVTAIIIIIAVAAVEAAKANRYPIYSKLTYSLAENCMCSPSLCLKRADNHRHWNRVFR